MLPGLMAYNNHRYDRWLTDYWAMLCSLPAEQLAFLSSPFAQSMTRLPYSCQPLDLFIETTMNLHSKLKQGWLPILQNEKQLFATTQNGNNISQIKSLVHNNVNSHRKLHHRFHAECQPARMNKDEQVIHGIIACMIDYEAYPFDISVLAL